MPDKNRNDDQFSRFSVNDDDFFRETFTPGGRRNQDSPPQEGDYFQNRDDNADYNDEDDDGAYEPFGEAGFEKRDYRPVRQRRDGRTGFLGGFMYFIFVISISVILACVGWMAASDVLALNKGDMTAEVTLDEDLFTPGTREVTDENGVTTTENVQIADIDGVATVLKDAGIIEYKILFKLYAAISNTKYKIDPGTYELSTQFDYRAIVKKMQFGSDSQVRTMVTFPEGFNIRQIFQRLEENKICRYDELMECAATYEFDYAFLEDIPYGDASRLEGFLFPDTYEFYQGMTPAAAINTFLRVLHESRLTAEILDLVEQSGYTLREILNIASLIEKEAANDEERGEIAGIIYNRLRGDWSLGVDAAILYDIDELNFDIDTPYNLRMYKGLPPTPICNPGLPSIMAALKPNTTGNWFYALDEATDTHRFFTNKPDFDNFVATQSYGQ